MNFNYSYKSFLITALLVGNLILLLFSIKLSNNEASTEEEVYDVEYVSEEIINEEKLATTASENAEIKTHKAYNEAEEFIENLENERKTTSEKTEEKISEMDEAILNANTPVSEEKNDSEINDFQKKQNEEKSITEANSSSRKTTISYNLLGRKALVLPNPVYTCEASGKIVINIEVNALGTVVKTSYNKQSSTTTNGCLIDEAIKYALRSSFQKSSKTNQIGTITYNFPGQQE